MRTFFIRRGILSFALCLFVVDSFGQLFTTTCVDDHHISADKRSEIDSAATQFINTLLGAQPGKAYEQFTTEARAEVTPEQVLQVGSLMLQPMKIERLGVDHTYLATLTGAAEQAVMCGSLADDQWVKVAARSGEQGHVLLSADYVNGRFAFEVWLVPENGNWRVQGFWFGPSSLASDDTAKLWDLARAERAKQHRLNATVLYATAFQTSFRGKYLQLGVTNAIREDASSFEPAPEISGTKPWEWRNGSTTYKIMNVGPIAIGGEIDLVVDQEVGHWTDDKQVDGWNKELQLYFKKKFPEYHDVFPVLLVRAHERGTNRGFTTVEESAAQEKK